MQLVKFPAFYFTQGFISVYKNLLLVPVLSQLSPVCILPHFLQDPSFPSVPRSWYSLNS